MDHKNLWNCCALAGTLHPKLAQAEANVLHLQAGTQAFKLDQALSID